MDAQFFANASEGMMGILSENFKAEFVRKIGQVLNLVCSIKTELFLAT